MKCEKLFIDSWHNEWTEKNSKQHFILLWGGGGVLLRDNNQCVFSYNHGTIIFVLQKFNYGIISPSVIMARNNIVVYIIK